MHDRGWELHAAAATAAIAGIADLLRTGMRIRELLLLRIRRRSRCAAPEDPPVANLEASTEALAASPNDTVGDHGACLNRCVVVGADVPAFGADEEGIIRHRHQQRTHPKHRSGSDEGVRGCGGWVKERWRSPLGLPLDLRRREEQGPHVGIVVRPGPCVG